MYITMRLAAAIVVALIAGPASRGPAYTPASPGPAYTPASPGPAYTPASPGPAYTPASRGSLYTPASQGSADISQGIQVPAPIAPAPRPRGNLAPRIRTLTYFIEDGATADGFKPGDRELAKWALQAWERNSGGTLRFVAAPEAAPRIRIKWVGAKEGQYGETVRDPRNRRASIVYIRPDTEALGTAIAEPSRLDPLLRDSIVYLTCLHELGHAIGLTHTADDRDIMYSFQFGGDIRTYFYHYRDLIKRREDIAVTPGLSVNDIDRIRTMFSPR